MQINVSYITANDIMEILGVGRSKAYEIVRVMNEELENAGYNIIKGKLHAANPAIADIPQNLHIGCLSSHPVSTGLVELAGDGKTAKGLWYSIAQETEAQPDGTGKALWMPEKIAVDFVKEKDGWKIWHIVVSTDLVSEAGEDYSEQEVYHNYETNPVDVEFGTPTIAKLIHNTDFNWWDNYPPMPEAYETFSDAVSYGPEGYVKPALYGLDSKEGRNFR